MQSRDITIAISTAFQDSGDATRAIEIAKSLRKYRPENFSARIIFISHGSKFEKVVLDLGFEVFHASPALPGVGLYQDFGMTTTNLFGTQKLAEEMIQGEIQAYKTLQPDIVLYAFWPVAGLARRMMKKEIPGICFVPLPIVPGFFDVIPDVPEQIKAFALLPKPLRLSLFRLIPYSIKSRAPAFRQDYIRHAAYKLGWQGDKLINVFDLLKADFFIVNDLSDYYDQSKLPSNVIFTGPLFSVAKGDEHVDPEISKVFAPDIGKIKIFCSLSSSGSENMLAEVIKAFTYGRGLTWNAVILAPYFPVEKARKILGDRDGVYITDKFIPATKVNPMANITVCHGGQGTVQTALVSGTPIVGVAAQQEQFINLSNVASRGAGIRIPLAKWKAENIQKAVLKILKDSKYHESALKLRDRILETNGARNAATVIWEKLSQTL